MNAVITAALNDFKPTLVQDSIRHVVGTFNSITLRYGPGLHDSPGNVSIYNSGRYRVWRDYIAPMVRFVQVPRHPQGPRSENPGYFELVPALVQADAQEYAEQTVLAWAAKIESKLGDLDSLEVERLDSYRFTIKGKLADKTIYIIQSIVTKTSSRGKPFNQFPARIYVNGRFHSEAAYKKLAAELKAA